jgi:hypothetical protein
MVSIFSRTHCARMTKKPHNTKTLHRPKSLQGFTLSSGRYWMGLRPLSGLGRLAVQP